MITALKRYPWNDGILRYWNIGESVQEGFSGRILLTH
jgi:hypothetical protein